MPDTFTSSGRLCLIGSLQRRGSRTCFLVHLINHSGLGCKIDDMAWKSSGCVHACVSYVCTCACVCVPCACVCVCAMWAPCVCMHAHLSVYWELCVQCLNYMFECTCVHMCEMCVWGHSVVVACVSCVYACACVCALCELSVYTCVHVCAVWALCVCACLPVCTLWIVCAVFELCVWVHVCVYMWAVCEGTFVCVHVCLLAVYTHVYGCAHCVSWVCEPVCMCVLCELCVCVQACIFIYVCPVNCVRSLWALCMSARVCAHVSCVWGHRCLCVRVVICACLEPLKGWKVSRHQHHTVHGMVWRSAKVPENSGAAGPANAEEMDQAGMETVVPSPPQQPPAPHRREFVQPHDADLLLRGSRKVWGPRLADWRGGGAGGDTHEGKPGPGRRQTWGSEEAARGLGRTVPGRLESWRCRRCATLGQKYKPRDLISCNWEMRTGRGLQGPPWVCDVKRRH